MTAIDNAAEVASLNEIRAQFPALARVHNGNPVAYFDGPGGTQVPRPVGAAMLEYLYHHNANTEWEYPTSAETDAMIADARSTFADFLNADANEIAFGANMTTLTFHLSRAIGRRLSPGDEIVVTELDHHANVDPWLELARDRDLKVRTVRLLTESGRLDWDDFQSAITPRTRLVAMGAASNALGTVNDVKTAAALAHDAGALMFVDAVHYAPHTVPDVRELDCDFLACSAYKFYGPHIGILYGRHHLLESLAIPKLQPAHDTAPENVETGTLNHEGIAGAAAAVTFLASLSRSGDDRRANLHEAFNELHHRGVDMVTQMWNGLEKIEGVTLYGLRPGERRTPTVAFTVEGVHSRDVARSLAEAGVFVSHGDFYAKTVVDRLGLSGLGLVRAGCAIYTTSDEVMRLVDRVRAIAARS